MPRPPARLEPRKAPKQQRSRETRERILAAAARVFARWGYGAGTTNRIAAEAGISVGSLYQYFPNKDAILVELVRAHVAEGARMVADRLADVTSLPPGIEERLEVFVDVALDSHRGDPRLHQVLFEEAPRPRDLLDELHEMEEHLVAAVEVLLRADRTVRVADHAVAARLVVTAIESLVHRHIATTRDDLDVARFRSELVAMLVRYLTG